MTIFVLVLVLVCKILFIHILLAVLILLKTIAVWLSVDDLFDFLVYLVLLSHHSLMCKLQRILL